MTEELIEELKGQEFIPRDLSWLAFNHRVLQEAADPSVPLYERIKFLAIFSSNLDEFYRVRVASYRTLRGLKKKERVSLNVDVKPNRRLKQIRKVVHGLQHEFGRIFRSQIIPGLADQGIQLLSYDDLKHDLADDAFDYFQRALQSGVEVKSLSEDLFLENHKIYLVSKVNDRMKILSWPAAQDRFVVLNPKNEFLTVAFVEDIIRLCQRHLTSEEWYAIKLSRDAELFVEEEQGTSIAEKVKASLANRDIGLPSRLLYDQSMPENWLTTLKQYLNLSKYDLIPGARYHHFSDFFTFPLPPNAHHMKDPAWPPLAHPTLEKVDSVWDAVQSEDQLLSFPYQKFDYLLRLLKESIADDRTHSIQMTIYRTGQKSPVVNALLEALDKGIKVFVFIEVKARFDERPNIFWGEELEKNGAEVRYSFDDLKVHTKCLLIERQGNKRLAWIGTGNFNHKTARTYADHAMLSCKSELTSELKLLFLELRRGQRGNPQFDQLWVAPYNLRHKINESIEKEIKLCKTGKQGWMVLKMNNLEDKELIRKLYQASVEGVQITLLVRGICCLNPKHSDAKNIRVLSLIDRYLEHARIYLFGNGGKEEMYLGSADWMTRNMDRRVEVVSRVHSNKIFREVRHLLSLQARDNVKNRQQHRPLQNTRLEIEEIPIRAQSDFHSFLEQKS
ncbi:MAG TPA: polyphosphate kinase 1 [Saprospiraceae bacterium]|nr:polyphosphate kinase 1 [Saprospiraceae bacterium]